jgi:hypothetical protein
MITILITAICSIVATLFIQSIWIEYKHRQDINKKFEEAEKLNQMYRVAKEVFNTEIKKIIKDNE